MKKIIFTFWLILITVGIVNAAQLPSYDDFNNGCGNWTLYYWMLNDFMDCSQNNLNTTSALKSVEINLTKPVYAQFDYDFPSEYSTSGAYLGFFYGNFNAVAPVGFELAVGTGVGEIWFYDGATGYVCSDIGQKIGKYKINFEVFPSGEMNVYLNDTLICSQTHPFAVETEPEINVITGVQNIFDYSYIDNIYVGYEPYVEPIPGPTPEPERRRRDGNNAYIIQQNLQKQADSQKPITLIDALIQVIYNIRKALGLE